MSELVRYPPLGLPADGAFAPRRTLAWFPPEWQALLLRAFAFVVLLLYLLTFLRIWDWGSLRFGSPLGVGARTPLIQYGGYLGVIVLTGLAVLRVPLTRLLAPCLPFGAFVGIGLLSGLAAAGEADFVRPIAFWLIGVAGLVSISGILGVRWLYSATACVILGSLVGSALVCTLQPTANVFPDPRGFGGVAWAGMFWEKNSLGLVAANAVLLALWWREAPKWLAGLLLVMAALCLARASSSGSSVALFGALGAATVGWLIRRLPLSAGARTALFLLVIVTTVGMLAVALPLVLEALGRDPTLTGRTDIWPAFLQRALMKPIFGWGPGTFTFPSYAIADLVKHFSSFGNISSPHNIFIAVLGDSGMLGFLSFVLPLLYLTFVVPFRTTGPTGLFSLAVGALIIVHGFVESAVIFGFSVNWIMLFLVLLIVAEERDGAAADRSSDQSAARAGAGMPLQAGADRTIQVLGR